MGITVPFDGKCLGGAANSRRHLGPDRRSRPSLCSAVRTPLSHPQTPCFLGVRQRSGRWPIQRPSTNPLGARPASIARCTSRSCTPRVLPVPHACTIRFGQIDAPGPKSPFCTMPGIKTHGEYAKLVEERRVRCMTRPARADFGKGCEVLSDEGGVRASLVLLAFGALGSAARLVEKRDWGEHGCASRDQSESS